ncbi:MAG: 2-hydroxychromene-2-carboxylate isomerase [Burkholderiaceae bacterium]
MPASLVFYFDFISPYGYFASREVEALAARHGREVDWRCMLLGVSVMKVMGLKPLLETPLKGDYVRRDVDRRIRRAGRALKRGPADPVMDPRACGRAFWWVKTHRPALAGAFAREVYEAYWREGLDLSSPTAVVSITLPPGIEAGWLLTGIESDEARSLLRENVDASLKAGVFGSPTLVVDGEPFWGVDAMPQAEEWLAGGGW